MALVGTASIRIRAITTDFEAELKRAVSKIQSLQGRGDIGDLFKNSRKSFAQIGREADAVYDSINGLVTKSYYLQSAISALVPVLASAGAGLFALGSQAASAGPALVVLPSMLTAIMQAAITAKLALGGVFKAVGELGRAKTSAIDQVPAKLEAFRSAQERLRRSTKALEKAYRDANERIEQLTFSIEDAAIAETRAAMALNDARATLARVQDLPPNSRARKEAELAFKEADLNYRRAVDTSKDLADEQNRVTKDGTLNSDEQIAQSEEVVNAIYENEQATKAVAKAQLELNKARKGSGALDEFNKLSKAGQEFAKFLANLKPKIQELKDAAGEKLFAPLQTAIQTLVDKFFPVLIPLLKDTGGAFGNAAIDFAKAVTSTDNLKNFEIVGRTNIDTIGKLGKVLGNLYGVFVAVLAAADPLIRRFTDWVVALTDGWRNADILKNEGGKLTDMFNKAGDAAAQLGDIIGNLIGGLINMGKAASGPGSGGQLIFDALERNTQKFKDWSKAVLEDGSLKEYFRGASENFLKTAGIFGKIFKIIAKSATQAGTGEFLDSISRAVDTLAVGFDHLVGAAPAFGKFIEGMARFIVAFMESGSIITFFEVLTTAVNFAASIFENEFVKKIFNVLAVLHGFKLAIMVLKGVFIAFGYYIIGMAQAVWAPLSAVFTFLTGTMGMAAGAAIGLMAGVAALVYVLVRAYMESEKFRNALADLGKAIWGALVDAVKEVREAFSSIFSSGSGQSITNGFKAFGDFLAAFIIPLLKVLIPAAISVLKNGIIGLMKIIGGVIKVVMGLFSIIMGVVRLFTGDFSGAWEGLSSGVANIVGGLVLVIRGIFQGLIAFLIGLFPPLLIPFALVRLAIAAIGTVLSFVWNNVIRPIFEAFGIVFRLVWDSILFYFNTIWTIITTAITFAWNNVIRPIFEAFGIVFRLVWDGILFYFNTIWTVIHGAITFAWNNIIRPVFEAFGTIFSKVWDGIKKAFSGAWDFITKAIDGAKTIFGKIGDAIIAAFKAAINFIIRGWNNLDFTIPKVKVAGISFGGFTIGLPDIPELAEGGIINPTPGGTLARIGEAGKAERVEPLDPDGLSKRDKAIIAMLSGSTGGGITLNVYPSPGMNEVELAALVNRQLAFQLRRGAA